MRSAELIVALAALAERRSMVIDFLKMAHSVL